MNQEQLNAFHAKMEREVKRCTFCGGPVVFHGVLVLGGGALFGYGVCNPCLDINAAEALGRLKDIAMGIHKPGMCEIINERGESSIGYVSLDVH
jgi:hypothetical protein